ncbi:MAG TPA: dicarboxylate/amino acid:cation symporter [Candidatus Coprenecus stercorigallinarum]|nr:dicarboxylate/amino acid:cation symporter [Candidatus Coprenecus stercorigallinarum]
MKRIKMSLLLKIVIAILLGIGCSYFFPEALARVFVTFNSLFGNFLNFIIPLLILGLVAPGIAELGKGAGKMLGVTTLLAYGSTVLAGYFSYGVCNFAYPLILEKGSFASSEALTAAEGLEPYFVIDMPPLFGVMSALILSFVLGLALASVKGNAFRTVLNEFREVIMLVIRKVIIPLLPLYIFGIFLKMGVEGTVMMIIGLFLKVIIVIFILHVVLLLLQFCIAGGVAGKNPLKCLKNMLPAYMTALGTQSSAATIPVTLAQAKKNGVRAEVADFVIPLCGTIHLSGSTLKIVACAFAISFMTGMPSGIGLYTEFIFMLGIAMVAAPGVPGGAIMASIGIIGSILGFDEDMQGLMIALYIAMDSFGTACNVTGDGAIALIVDRIFRKA